MNKAIVYTLIGLVIIIGLYFSINSGEDPEAYRAEILEFRQEKNEFMRTSANSPFKGKSFSALSFYPPDLEFKVTAKIERIEERSYLNIPTSDGKNEQYLKYAYAEFDLKGQRLRLLILKKMGMGASNVLFTAFADDTSGEETYGGGRYIDLSFKNAKRIDIDFNKAYNPYCEYDAKFSCPLPPKENILPIAITAGEKRYPTP